MRSSCSLLVASVFRLGDRGANTERAGLELEGCGGEALELCSTCSIAIYMPPMRCGCVSYELRISLFRDSHLRTNISLSATHLINARVRVDWEQS